MTLRDQMVNRCENTAVRAAARARSEQEIERRTSAGNPPTAAELAHNEFTLNRLDTEAAFAEKELAKYDARKAAHA